MISSKKMWSDDMSGAKDTWGTWGTARREKLFDVIERNRMGGVLLLSGDCYCARGFTIRLPLAFRLAAQHEPHRTRARHAIGGNSSRIMRGASAKAV